MELAGYLRISFFRQIFDKAHRLATINTLQTTDRRTQSA